MREIEQFDIPDRQLMASGLQPRGSMWTDIGEARVTHTIFGRAKVRIIRQQDRVRRVWLLALLVLLVLLLLGALAFSVWQQWQAEHQTEALLGTSPSARPSTKVQVTAPAFQIESRDPPMAVNKPNVPLPADIEKLMSGKESVPQFPYGVKASEPSAAKPLVPKPLIAAKPLTTPSAPVNGAGKNQAGMQPPAKLPAPRQPVAPVVAKPPAAQPVVKRAVPITPLDAPLIDEPATVQPPVGNLQPAAPVKVQP